MNDKPAKIEMVTLKQLCAELKVDPREARERLRLAVRDAKKNPELTKSHKLAVFRFLRAGPGPWSVPTRNPALAARRRAT